jgi:hypothetical protein
MKMKVKDFLPSVATAIHNQPVAFSINVFQTGQLAGYPGQMPQELLVLRFNVIETGNMQPGYQKNVYRCHRVYVVKGYNLLIFIDDLRRYFTAYDLAKDTVLQGNSP